jgi:TRAP-type C4-dicarboxylate transport system substrate-binding protein
MVIDKKAFDRISAPDQRVVREILTNLYSKYNVQNLKDDKEAKQALFAAGLTRVVPDAAKLDELRQVLHESNEAMARRGVVSLELYEEMMRYVAESRADQATIATAEEIAEVQ